MPRVLITPVYLNHVEGPYRETLEAAGFEVVYPSSERPLSEQLDGIDAVIASVEPYSDDLLGSSRLRVIARNGVGFDSIDIEAATEQGIVVTITPGANKEAVAEHAIAMMLALAHGFPGRDRRARRGIWQRTPLPRLAGKTLGLIGFGAIGKAMVPLALGLGLQTIAHDPIPDRRFAEEQGVRLCALDDLLAEADVVSLHVPVTSETVDLINAETLTKMKPGAILINTARGTLVDEDVLAEALRDGRLAGAGLDVFRVEPLPTDSPLASLDNVLICPHMGGLDQESLALMARLAAESIVMLHRNEWPEGRVANPNVRDGWQW